MSDKRKDTVTDLTKKHLSAIERTYLADNLEAVEREKKLREEENKRWATGNATLLDKLGMGFAIGIALFGFIYILVAVIFF